MVETKNKITITSDNERKIEASRKEYGRSGIEVSSIGPVEYTGIDESHNSVIPTAIEKPAKVNDGTRDEETLMGIDNQTIVDGREMMRPDRDSRLLPEAAPDQREAALAELYASALEIYHVARETAREVIFETAWAIESNDAHLKKVVALEIKAILGEVDKEHIDAAFRAPDGELPPAVSTGPIIDLATLIAQLKSALVKELYVRNLGTEEWVKLDVDSRAYLVELLIRQCVLPHFWLKWILNGKINKIIDTTPEGYEQLELPVRTLNQVIFNRGRIRKNS